MSSRQGFYRCIPFIALLLAASVAWAVPSGSAAPNAGTPVFVTTAGQSADAHAVKLLLDRSQIASGYDAVAEAADQPAREHAGAGLRVHIVDGEELFRYNGRQRDV